MTEADTIYNEILGSGHFHADWYLENYQDVALAIQDPLEHYLTYGVSEGRDPGPDFSTSGYLARYRDVAEAGINPLLHYIRYGKREGRLTTPCLDPHLIKRPYDSIESYLTYALLDPLVNAPFSTVDLENFRMMEKIAQWLCRKQQDGGATPLVSVVMPMRDRAGVVGDAIRSVLKQSYENFELIIIDDGSKDESVKVVDQFADQRVHLIESKQSAGVSAARNSGLAAARGELIAYLDSDNTWQPDYLRAMVGAFSVRPDADAAYCGQYLYRGYENEPFAVRFGSYNPSLLRNRNYIDLNCFIHRQQIIDSIDGGFWDEINRWVDWELIIRISQVGRICSVPILQSNYYLDKAENTITAVEALPPAREAIRAKWGYRKPSNIPPCNERLTRKVAVIVPCNGGMKELKACIDSLADYFCLPLVEIIVNGEAAGQCDASDFYDLKPEGGKIAFAAQGTNVYASAKLSDPDSDILVLDSDATLCHGALTELQKVAHGDQSIGIVAPQCVFPEADPAINVHVPYAFNDVPCDVNLSNHLKNVEPLPLFHDGSLVELNFVSFSCAYVRREVWDVFAELNAGLQEEQLNERLFCEFVRYVLGRKIVYVPDAVAFFRTTDGRGQRAE